MTINLATWEAELRRLKGPYLENTQHKKKLAEWLKW
jgi:hypothetical protein